MRPNYEDERNLTSIIIGLVDAVRWQDDAVDLCPFTEKDNIHIMQIPGEGIVYVAERFGEGDSRKRAMGGVIE